MTTLELCPLKTRSPQVYTYSLNNTSSVKFQGLETYKEGLAQINRVYKLEKEYLLIPVGPLAIIYSNYRIKYDKILKQIIPLSFCVQNYFRF